MSASSFRRSHKKSRAGCLECKRRHIKCDESRPVCKLCTMAERGMYCTYASQAPSNLPEKTPKPTAGPSASIPIRERPHSPTDLDMSQDDGIVHGVHSDLPPLRLSQLQHATAAASYTTAGTYFGVGHTVANTNTNSQTSSSDSTPSLPGEALNIDHIELLIHITGTRHLFNLGVNIGSYHDLINLGLSYGLQAPYLLHQLLAYSARHLAHFQRHREHHFLHQADAHQTRAIHLFNAAIAPASSSSPSLSPRTDTSPGDQQPVLNESNCVPIVLFSSILGQTLIVDTFDRRLHPTFTHPHGDLDAFLSSYTQCMNTFRGVFSLSLASWPLLLSSVLGHHLAFSAQFNAQPPVGSHCDNLFELLDTTHRLGKLSDTEHATCHRMATYLQVGFDAIFTPERNKILNPNPTSSEIDPQICYKSPPLSSPALSTSNDPSLPGSTTTTTVTNTPPFPEPAAPLTPEIDTEMTATNRYLNRYQMLAGWTMLAPPEFSALLVEKRAEALVMLGYYAQLLYYGRHMWQIGDAGRCILGMVLGYLGEEWRGWLSGPVGVVLEGRG